MEKFTVNRCRDSLEVAAPDGKRWTVWTDFEDRVVRIRSSGKRDVKLDGPTGRRVIAAVETYVADCTKRLPAALDEYVRAVIRSDADAPSVWRRCEQLGATWNDYIRARDAQKGSHHDTHDSA